MGVLRVIPLTVISANKIVQTILESIPTPYFLTFKVRSVQLKCNCTPLLVLAGHAHVSCRAQT